MPDDTHATPTSQPAIRGRAWSSTDRTGGPLDDLLDQVRAHQPNVVVGRLEVTHPGDDDNVYFLGDEHSPDIVQVDTNPGGQPPFLIEAHKRHTTSDTAEAATIIRAWLRENAASKRPPP